MMIHPNASADECMQYIGELEFEVEEAEHKIDLLLTAILRIDGINDNPACFNIMIEEVVRRVLKEVGEEARLQG